MPEFHLPLAAEDRGVAAELQAALVDLIDRALIGKQAHWIIAGPQFRWVHSELDERADEEDRHASAGGQRVTCARGSRPAGSRGNTNPRGVPDER